MVLATFLMWFHAVSHRLEMAVTDEEVKLVSVVTMLCHVSVSQFQMVLATFLMWFHAVSHRLEIAVTDEEVRLVSVVTQACQAAVSAFQIVVATVFIPFHAADQVDWRAAEAAFQMEVIALINAVHAA
jgi:hypothetical protein